MPELNEDFKRRLSAALIAGGAEQRQVPEGIVPCLLEEFASEFDATQPDYEDTVRNIERQLKFQVRCIERGMLEAGAVHGYECRRESHADAVLAEMPDGSYVVTVNGSVNGDMFITKEEALEAYRELRGASALSGSGESRPPKMEDAVTSRGSADDMPQTALLKDQKDAERRSLLSDSRRLNVGTGGMEARNRTLPQWFERIRSRQISLPRFQRMEAWGPNEVSGLLTTVLRGLPAGSALVLQVGDEMPFVHRAMRGAPSTGDRITELLLDGQQRLTCIWRALYDDYDDRTYLVRFIQDPHRSDQMIPSVYGEKRRGEGKNRMPKWVDQPRECWAHGCIPVSLLRPGDDTSQVDEWIESIVGNDLSAYKQIQNHIRALKECILQFNLPFLSLPPSTPKDVALDVFIKMNTSAVTLTTFDIIVAQVESNTGDSLHDMVGAFRGRIPAAEEYRAPQELILDTAALLQDRTPNQSGYWAMDLGQMVDDWEAITAGIEAMVALLGEEGILDRQRLPSVAVLPVIAALWRHMPLRLDALGNAKSLLRKYLWRSSLTDRYESAAAGKALNDFRALRAVLSSEATEELVPVFDEAEYPSPTADVLINTRWPKNVGILPRGILCLTLRCGAHDIADDAQVTRAHVKQREYHHLYPYSLLQSASVADQNSFSALNCALITSHTNRTISNKEPVAYLKERANANSLGEDDLRRRLRTHLVPYDSLAAGGWMALNEEERALAIRRDYERFLNARATVISNAIDRVYAGRDILDIEPLFAGASQGDQW